MKKYTWEDVELASEHIALKMYQDLWRPDYIVGVTKTGMVLATILSNKVSVPLISLQVDLENEDPGCESNLWLAEWAFGYNNPEETGITGCRWDPKLRKKILVVDSVNNTGGVFNWIKNDWEAGCLPNEADVWEKVWHNTVRFAVMVENPNSVVTADYAWEDYDPSSDAVFPWNKLQIKEN